MSLDSRASALHDLQKLGLLAEEQRLQAIDHPRLGELPEQPSMQATLEWLLRAGIITAKSLLFAAGSHHHGLDAAAMAVRRTLAKDTLRKINQDSVDALLAETLISQEVHAAISESPMTDRVFLTPAAAMTLLIEARVVSWQEFEALQARPASARSAAANTILAETVVLVDARERALKREFWGQLFPGPLWLYIVGVPLLIGVLLWYFMANDAIPGCDSDRARKTIDTTILFSRIDSQVARLGNGSDLGSYPSVRNLRQVGYNKVRDVRGCMAQMTIDGETRPFGYVIERDPARKKDGFILRGAEADIVTARFGKLDADGDFVHKAEPIGRTALEQAFRAGTAALGDDPVNQRAAIMMRAMTGKSSPDKAAQSRRDDDIEPTGACRVLKPGESYTCPLMAEWSNPLMGMLGQNDREIVSGEFTFERNAAGATPAWRVSADFTDEFQRAQLATLKKKAAAEAAAASAAK